jgi:hypothetical protein
VGAGIAWIVALNMAGCSGGASDTPQTDADGGGPGADAAAIDPAPAPGPDAGSETGPGSAVVLSAIDPADTTPHVSLLTQVVLTFSGSLDGATVTGQTVRLFAPFATAPLRATVSYDDASHTVTVIPATALSANGTYRVTTSKLTGKDGTPITDVATSFATLQNAQTDDTSYDATGTKIVSRHVSTLTADGRLAKNTLMAAGPDAMLGTADDVPASYVTFDVAPPGTQTHYYSAAGPDGVWFTADDVTSNYNRTDLSVPGQSRSVYYKAAGVDGVWGTADDVVGTFGKTLFDPSGREASSIYDSGPGPDAAPYTADDLISYRFTDTWTATTNQRLQYTSPGPDGVWLTADDAIGSVNDDSVDAAGHVTAIAFKAAGPDATWLTADDVITAKWTWTYDAKGLVTRISIFAGPGPDATWGTADDVLSSAYDYTTNAANGATTQVQSHSSAGPDGIWFTADDIISYTAHYDATK